VSTPANYRFREGDRVKATLLNGYLNHGNITVGSEGTVVEVSEIPGKTFPYLVLYDNFNTAPLWTGEVEVEAAE
jgi:hypothetical protein